jgi:hypothetical protein
LDRDVAPEVTRPSESAANVKATGKSTTPPLNTSQNVSNLHARSKTVNG